MRNKYRGGPRYLFIDLLWRLFPARFLPLRESPADKRHSNSLPTNSQRRQHIFSMNSRFFYVFFSAVEHSGQFGSLEISRRVICVGSLRNCGDLGVFFFLSKILVIGRIYNLFNNLFDDTAGKVSRYNIKSILLVTLCRICFRLMYRDKSRGNKCILCSVFRRFSRRTEQ